MNTFTARDMKMFAVARDLARLSTHNKAHIGAVLVSARDIISVGINGRKSHPMQLHYNSFRFLDESSQHLMHAEIEAIVRGRNHLCGDNRIYIYREMKLGMMGMSRPCAGCVRALRDFNIHSAYYTTVDGYAFERFL